MLERRAIQIKLKDVIRFAEELNSINWCKKHLLFLDEVSFDNRGMLRNRGYALKGRRLIFRGEFIRKPRISYLAFICESGLVDYFEVGGTLHKGQI